MAVVCACTVSVCKNGWVGFSVTQKRWVNSQYLPLEWIINCVKAWHQKGGIRLAFLFWQPKLPHTVGAMEHIFQFLLAWGERSEAEWRKSLLIELIEANSNKTEAAFCSVLFEVEAYQNLNHISADVCAIKTMLPVFALCEEIIMHCKTPSLIHICDCVAQDIRLGGLWWMSCKDVDKGPDEHWNNWVGGSNSSGPGR